MNKKIKKLCVLLMIICVVSACSKNDKKDESVKEDNVLMSNAQMAYSSKGYYNCTFNQIIFYDLESDTVLPLCNKAECSHTDQSTCNSYISGIVSGIQYQDGVLYFLVKNSDGKLVLQQEDMDGTNRKDVCVLAQSYVASENDVEFIVDGDYIFVKLYTPSGEDNIQSIYYKKIEDNNDIELVYEGENAGEVIQLPQSYNGKAYFTTNYCAVDENQKLVIYGDLYSYDLIQKERKSLWSDADFGFTLLKNELYYNNHQGEIRKVNLDTMENELLTTLDEDNKYFYLSVDSKYLYVDNGPAANVLNPKGLEARAIYVYDHDGKLVETLDIPGVEAYSINLSGDDKYLAIYDGAQLILFDKSQIGSKNSEWKTVNILNQE